MFEQFRDSNRISLNDKYIGDDGAKELGAFLLQHKKCQVLELKSNDISAEGFTHIFEALRYNPTLRQLVLEYNNLGLNEFEGWEHDLSTLVLQCPKLERLNLSNNKISTESFIRLSSALAQAKTLKLLQIRYNNITDIQSFLDDLKKHRNESLLFVETSGNKLKREAQDALQTHLKQARTKNTTTKDKIISGGLAPVSAGLSQTVNPQSGWSVNAGRQQEDQSLTKENVIRHLEDILDQNRRETTEMKVRMERELEELNRKEKNDAQQLQQLDTKCNQLTILNRNLKFELDRTQNEHSQIAQSHQSQNRQHQLQLRDLNKELIELEARYSKLEEEMTNSHQYKLKEISREWENRIRMLQDRIKMSENQTNTLENQLAKQLERKERLRIEYLEEEHKIRTHLEEEERFKYDSKLNTLESKLTEAEESRTRLNDHNRTLAAELQEIQASTSQQLEALEAQLASLRSQEEQFVRNNSDFLTRNETLKSEVQLKELSIQQLEDSINMINAEIENYKQYHRDQAQKAVSDHEDDRANKQAALKNQLARIEQLEVALRNAQLEGSKLRTEYGLLAQRLQISLGKAVEEAFTRD